MVNPGQGSGAAAYGGDDVSALVLDAGTYWTKAGYAGEDTPTAVFASDYRRVGSGGDMDVDGQQSSGPSSPYVYGESAMLFREHAQVRSAFNKDDGTVADWDAYEALLEYTFRERMHVDPAEQPLLVSEPAANPKEQRAKLAELLFEKLQAPALFLARAPVLAAFAAGRPTALVVDVGAGKTTVAAVYDGYVLNKATQTQALAGNHVSANALQVLKDSMGYDPVPIFRIAKKRLVETGKPADPVLKKLANVDPSFEQAAKLCVADEFKMHACELAETTFNHENLAIRPQRAYEFPDGFHANFTTERFRITEALFNPVDFLATTSSADADGEKPPLVGIQQMILDAVNAVDVDVKPLLLNNIVLTGGTTLLPTFADRLNNELLNAIPGMKIKIHAAGTSAERRFGNWIGGSVLASLGTFHQMWVSKQEYEENGGMALLEKRCP